MGWMNAKVITAIDECVLEVNFHSRCCLWLMAQSWASLGKAAWSLGFLTRPKKIILFCNLEYISANFNFPLWHHSDCVQYPPQFALSPFQFIIYFSFTANRSPSWPRREYKKRTASPSRRRAAAAAGTCRTGFRRTADGGGDRRSERWTVTEGGRDREAVWGCRECPPLSAAARGKQTASLLAEC